MKFFQTFCELKSSFSEQFHHMYRNTGNFTFATIDYYYENIFGRLDDPVMPRMTALIDPYEYRDRLIMPKLIISSTGDEFFMPDDRIG